MTQPLLADPQRRRQARRPIAGRRWKNKLFVGLCIATAAASVGILAVLLLAIFVQGAPRLTWTFLTSPPSPIAAEAGVRPALFGTLWVCAGCAVLTLPIGVATAVFLEEFKPAGRGLRLFHGFVQLNITNLAGVPSVVYGILGLTAFVMMFGLGSPREPVVDIGVQYYDQFLIPGKRDRVLFVPAPSLQAPPAKIEPGMMVYTEWGEKVRVHVIGPDDPLPEDEARLAVTLRSDAEPYRIGWESWYYFRLPIGRGVLAGSLTLMLVVLPIVIISSQEALRGVPDSLRDGALGLGATPWQVVWNVTLPASIPGIMTGSILAMSRAIGEAAPILIIAGTVFIAWAPSHLMDDFSVMPLQIYNWAKRPQEELRMLAASGIIVLLALLLAFNAVAVFIRHKMQKPLS